MAWPLVDCSCQVYKNRFAIKADFPESMNYLIPRQNCLGNHSSGSLLTIWIFLNIFWISVQLVLLSTQLNSTFRWLRECYILILLTNKWVELPTVLVPKKARRCCLLDAGRGGSLQKDYEIVILDVVLISYSRIVLYTKKYEVTWNIACILCLHVGTRS